ncbi:MAG TPA: glycerophosphodiester phosphodiesterase family protein [Vicinamibacteria bacterium]
MSRRLSALAAIALAVALPIVSSADGSHHRRDPNVQLGPRPYYLVEDMDDGPLKRELQSCSEGPFERTDFAIGHRGACLQFPEHTRESYEAAARMGAGIVECDVTFTKDLELVCRHAQCDLHTTTNILASPLADRCSAPFVPAEIDPVTGAVMKPASAKCCTSDLTLAEFKSLKGKMDAFNPAGRTVAEYIDGTPSFRTDLYASPYDGATWGATLLSHKESIALFESLGVRMTPELKAPEVPMPFGGTFSQEDYAQKMIDEYKEAGVSPRSVWAQSFNIQDVLYWVDHEPRFGRQAVYLDDANVPADVPSYADLVSYRQQGIRIVAPPTWVLLALDAQGKIVPSAYARNARRAGLDIITWTLERSGPLYTGGGFYYQSVTPSINNDGDTFTALDVLAREVGVLGVFSDWAATVTYYDNCRHRRHGHR